MAFPVLQIVSRKLEVYATKKRSKNNTKLPKKFHPKKVMQIHPKIQKFVTATVARVTATVARVTATVARVTATVARVSNLTHSDKGSRGMVSSAFEKSEKSVSLST